MANFKVLVADDEAPARTKMLRLLQEFDNLEVVNVSTNGLEALSNIASLRPDIVFLDIEMPGMSGLDVARNLPHDHTPHVVFATAYNEHAITAFEVNAIDYLLKPFDRDRLEQALDKIERATPAPDATELEEKLTEVAQQLNSAVLNKIPIPTADRYKLLNYDEVYSIEVEDRITSIYTNDKIFPINMTLEAFEKKLPGSHFMRISRSAIINIHQVKEIVLWFGNRYKVILNNKREVISSREKSKLLKQIVKF
jgi:DNA-binding LytR/AlgR family response regulator